MKFFALCLVFLVAGAYAVQLTTYQKDVIRAVVLFCTNKSGTTLEIVKAMHKGHWDNVDDKAKCFFACSVTVNGFIKNGVINETEISHKFSPIFGKQTTDAAISACKLTQGNNPCHLAFNLFTCLYENGIRVPTDFV